MVVAGPFATFGGSNAPDISYIATRVSFRIFVGGGGGANTTIPELRGGQRL